MRHMSQGFNPNACRYEILKFRTYLRRFESREMSLVWKIVPKFDQKLEWKKQLGIHRRTEIYVKRTG